MNVKASKRERTAWSALPPKQSAALVSLWSDRRVLGRLFGARTEAALLRARLARYPIACPAPRGAVFDTQGSAMKARAMQERFVTLAAHLADPLCNCVHLELTVDGVRAVLTLYPHLRPKD